MRLTNNEDYSLSVAVWLATDRYNHNRYPGKEHISATGLLKPMRMIVLGNRAASLQTAEADFDISKNVPSRMGTAIHAGLEWAWKNNAKQALLDLGKPKALIDKILVNPTPEERKQRPDAILVYIEQRTHKEIDGFIVDGEFDFVGDGILEDFKSTGVYSYMKGNRDEEHILQGSIYRWLNPELITADFMRIQYVFTDWSKLDAKIKKKKGYPTQRILAKKLKLMPLQEIENFIRGKIREIKSLRNTPEPDLPQCSAEDLWQSPPTYKYFGNINNKRATANFDNYAEAHARMTSAGKGIIKEFSGQVRRCGYCPAFDLCSQKDIYQANGTLVLP